MGRRSRKPAGRPQHPKGLPNAAMSSKAAQHPQAPASPATGRKVVPVPSSSMLAAVKAAADGVDSAGDRLSATVAAARIDGHTWRAIGAALGMSPQSAHRKFGPSKVTDSGEGGPVPTNGE
jgi:hypothetical protein